MIIITEVVRMVTTRVPGRGDAIERAACDAGRFCDSVELGFDHQNKSGYFSFYSTQHRLLARILDRVRSIPESPVLLTLLCVVLHQLVPAPREDHHEKDEKNDAIKDHFCF